MKRQYIVGKTIEEFGSMYLVESVKRLSAQYMKAHDLYKPIRVRLRKISGENGMDIMEFGIDG